MAGSEGASGLASAPQQLDLCVDVVQVLRVRGCAPCLRGDALEDEA